MLDIATGKSRKTVNWENKKVSWEWLVSRLGKTHKTHENYADYLSMEKAEQDSIKDVGGFVGGYLLDGRRGKGTVKHRQLITLDVDFLPANYPLWDDFTMLYGCAALIYSTHKHSAKTPRYRIVLPLNRKVDNEQYEAISRKIAGNLGIKYFDATTFQNERLMYWPSTAKDAKFFFASQEGKYMDVDKVLGSYTDWQDRSSWPVCPNETRDIKRELKNQEDPRDKKNLIGAFCRSYSISEAIEQFLDDVYTPTDNMENRYTYVEGSTGGGAICYDDLFLYSHHNSDPAGGQLCNAFDLVRIHLYSHLDEAKDNGKPVTSQKSFTKMLENANSDSRVIKDLGEFEGLTPGDWLLELDRDKKTGKYDQTINNVLLILDNDAELKDKFGFNRFDMREYVLGSAPWNKATKVREFTDRDDAGLRLFLEKKYGIFQISKTRDAVDVTVYNNPFHPIQDYIKGLKWDGVERLETIFVDHLGAEDNEYVRAVTRKSIVACVARVFDPGVKFDTILTLIGPQGLGKSSIFKELGGAWFSNTLGNIHTKEAAENIQGVWIMEIAELAGFKKAEVEIIKNFVTTDTDRFRVAYGRRSANFPRQTVFFGSANKKDFLTDPTGNRRFWPIEVGKKYRHNLMPVNQIWAEAKQLYDLGESLYLNDDIEIMANKIQLSHAEVDDRKGVIEAYLNMLLPENWENMSIFERRSYIATEYFEGGGVKKRTHVCAAEIWCEALKGDYKDMTTFNTKPIHNIMQGLDRWESTINKPYPIYGYQRTYKVKGAAIEDRRAAGKRKAVRKPRIDDDPAFS